MRFIKYFLLSLVLTIPMLIAEDFLRPHFGSYLPLFLFYLTVGLFTFVAENELQSQTSLLQKDLDDLQKEVQELKKELNHK